MLRLKKRDRFEREKAPIFKLFGFVPALLLSHFRGAEQGGSDVGVEVRIGQGLLLASSHTLEVPSKMAQMLGWKSGLGRACSGLLSHLGGAQEPDGRTGNIADSRNFWRGKVAFRCILEKFKGS